MDLGELWRERRWRLLLVILTQLPKTSHTKAALTNDEDFARQVLRGRDMDDLRSSGGSVSLTEFTPEVAALFSVIDRLGEVCAGLVGLGGKKPQRVKPVPRPKTAFERIAFENRLKAHKSLVSRVLRPVE